MNGANKFTYWDTSIFLAYLNNEASHRPGEMSWVREKIQEFEIGSLNITTSVIAITEIMEISRLNHEQRNTLTNWFNRSNFRFIDANRTICDMASNIRSAFKANPIQKNGKSYHPFTPDAIHVASAIYVRRLTQDLDLALITLDSKNKSTTGELAMTEMSSYTEKNYGLKVITPPLRNDLLTILEE